jgi:chromosome segregation ATPase
MDNQVSKSKLGALNWAAMLAPAKPAEAPSADSKPVETQAKPEVSHRYPLKPKKDVIDISVPRRGASGSAIKEQVMRIDGEISSLNKALYRNQVDLADAHVERADLSDALARKLKRAEELKKDLSGAHAEKAQIKEEIAEIAGKIDAVDAKIDGLKSEQDALIKREAELAKQHRTQYGQARGAQDYADYLKTLPGYAQGDDAFGKVREEAASEEARRAQDRMHATEGKLTETNTRQAVISIEGYFLDLRRGKLHAQGEAKEGELDATQQRIDHLEVKQEKLEGRISENREQLAKVDAQIAKTEKTIATIERKISDLEGLRDEVLGDAIQSRLENAEELADKIAELEKAITRLKGELSSTRDELKDLKDLRESYDK